MAGSLYEQHSAICDEILALTQQNNVLCDSEVYWGFARQEVLLNTLFAQGGASVTQEMVAELRRLAEAVKQLDQYLKTNEPK